MEFPLQQHDENDAPEVVNNFDLDLLGFFTTGRITLLFEGLPEEERNARLTDLNRILSPGTLHVLEHGTGHRSGASAYRRYFYSVSIGGYFSIPVLKVKTLWRDYYPRIVFNLTRWTRHMMAMITVVIRLLFSVFSMIIMMREVLKILIRLMSFTVRSNNFVGDIITYLVKDTTGYNDTYVDICRHDGYALYFLDDSDFDDIQALQYIRKIIHYLLSQSLSMKCNTVPVNDSEFTCVYDTNSILFSFEKVVRANFPQFSLLQVEWTTLFICTSYVVVATFAALWVFVQYETFWAESSHYKFYIALVKNIKKLVSNVL